MEIYVAYKDYFWMMNFTEEMLEHVVTTVNKGSTEVMLGEKTLNFKAPFARVTMVDAIIKYTGYDITGMDEAALHDVCKALHIETNDSMGKGKLIDEIFGEKCEGNYIQPTFIIDYPIEMSPLCKKHRDNPDFTERFELMINGKEVANAYTELNDPIDQRERFEEQLSLSAKGDDEAMFIDQDFLRALEFGMPPTSGMGIGIDRLTMMLTNNTSIQEVLFFPQMKPENKEQKKVLELNDGEKAIFKILKEENRLALDDLKTRAGLSNKAWDKSIKGLAKMGLTKVSKTEEGLFVELTED
jgi:lysyl-tRNA synthetase class 2